MPLRFLLLDEESIPVKLRSLDLLALQLLCLAVLEEADLPVVPVDEDRGEEVMQTHLMGY